MWLSDSLQRVTAQHLQAEGDVVDPTTGVDANEATKQGRAENSESFLVWVIVSWEDLRRNDTSKEMTLICVKS